MKYSMSDLFVTSSVAVLQAFYGKA